MISLRPLRLLLVGVACLSALRPLRGQTAGPVTVPISNEGVVRATTVVDAVFVERRIPAGAVGGADWAAYLMARLGVRPIPEMPYVVVGVDSTAITMTSRIGDLPAQTRAELGPMVGFLDPATPISATLLLQAAGPEAVRFHLESVSINGFPVPEPFLQPYLSGVGQRYPMLTASGRDLLVQIPPNARVALAPDSIRLSLP